MDLTPALRAWSHLALGLLVLQGAAACEGNVVGADATDDVWAAEVSPPDAEGTSGDLETTSEVAPQVDATDEDAPDPEDGGADDSGTEEPLVAACLNPNDLTIIHDADNDIQGDAGSFGQSCMGSTDMTACTIAKLLEKHSLTVGCSTCFAEVLTCIVERCLLKCAADPSSDTCACCQETKGCSPEFFACSGLPNDAPPDCDD